MMSNEDYKIVLQQDQDHPQEFLISKSETFIGREAGLDIVIDAVSVSRRHARILRQAEGLYLEDLGSSNGTFLNGERLSQPALLSPDDQIRLGLSIELTFEVASCQ